jgi:hypothetical protein
MGGGSNPYNDPNLVSIFDGTFNGWTQVPANSWTIMGGAMHSLGTARGFIYTSANMNYGSFRWIFTERIIMANHQVPVLIWGNNPGADALAGIQMQVPNGSMWDYRKTGPTANKDPAQFEKRVGAGTPGMAMQWYQCEVLADNTKGSLRDACCPVMGTTPCKATEIMDFTDPAAMGAKGPVALQIHNGGIIQEFKNLYIESPVVTSPGVLITTQ